MPDFPLFPQAATGVARQVDALFLAWLGISLFFAVLIFILITVFFIHFRRRRHGETGDTREVRTLPLELTWSVIPLIIALAMFAWGAKVFFVAVPAAGRRHRVLGHRQAVDVEVPAPRRACARSTTCTCRSGQPVKLTMTSEDVIHSFFVPAFRVKADVLPGRYTTVWFDATKPGRYHLFCAEYCGTEHSRMIGTVVVLTPEDYERWLATGRTGRHHAGRRRRAVPAARLRHLPPGEAPPGALPPRAPSLEGSSATRWRWPAAAP